MGSLTHALVQGLKGKAEGDAIAERQRILAEQREEDRAARVRAMERDDAALEMRQNELIARGYIPDDDDGTTTSGEPQQPDTTPRITVRGKRYRLNRQSPQGNSRTESSEAKKEERLAHVRAINGSLPPGKQKSEAQMALIASNESLFNAWANTALGHDPVSRHEQMRSYDRKNPLPPRARARGTSGPSTSASLGVVDRQLSETRSDMGKLESSVANRPTFFRSPSDSSAFEKRKADLARARQKVDSLTRVRDSIGDVVQGKRPVRRQVIGSQQQQDWDEAAAVLRARNQRPESVLGPRPSR